MNGPWECFHCGFRTADPKEAAGHFGDRDDGEPLCLVWQDLDSDGRASEYQNVYGQLQEEYAENRRLTAVVEGLEHRLLEFENLLGSRFKNCRTINDAFNVYDSMEGRAIAAEKKLQICQALLDPDQEKHRIRKYEEAGLL